MEILKNSLLSRHHDFQRTFLIKKDANERFFKLSSFLIDKFQFICSDLQMSSNFFNVLKNMLKIYYNYLPKSARKQINAYFLLHKAVDFKGIFNASKKLIFKKPQLDQVSHFSFKLEDSHATAYYRTESLAELNYNNDNNFTLRYIEEMIGGFLIVLP